MRKSGILLHIASLPNKYGIGTMGREAYKFVDWLRSAGQSLWQILPLSQTSFGDSPYQSFSIYAGNPYFISLETLEEEGLLKHKEYADINWCKDPRYIDYATMYENFYKVMRLAFGRFSKAMNGNVSEEYKAFVAENPWLENYTLFMALKDAHGGKSWCEWETPLRLRDVTAVYSAKKKYAKDMEFYAFLQFEFFRQWYKLKKYANDNGIQIIGDIPIYCALDSADVWCESQLFQLDRDRVPTVVAGFPPDAFSEDGQLWGNPIYDWDRMKQENYRWWVGRMSFAKKLYDIVRIDHFIGFNSYYAIPFGNKTAHGGEWHDGPKYDLFNVIKRETGKGGIIAEDLGIITPSVRKLLKQAAYPGMKVLQFAFDPTGKSEYLPQNYTSQNCVVYTSTHDSDTALGWFNNLDRKTKQFVKEYLGVRHAAELPEAFIDIAWKSTADMAMTTMQELCGFGTEARINVPSTIGNNWRWRTLESDFTAQSAAYLDRLTEISNRKPPVKKSRKNDNERSII